MFLLIKFFHHIQLYLLGPIILQRIVSVCFAYVATETGGAFPSPPLIFTLFVSCFW